MGEPLLRVHGLTKRFGGLVATDGVDLSVEAGEIHALIGPNGAGKTTLIHQLSGALAPDHGHVRFAGADITSNSVHRRVRLGIARSYQITSIFDQMSVLDNLALAVQARSGSSLRFWHPVASEESLFREATDLASEIGLDGRERTAAGQLSHGEQRQLEVGLALATRPRLVLLDEPLAGMSPDEVEPMIALIEGLRGRVAVLLVEHDIDAVFRLSDRISVLVSGRRIATGKGEEIRNNEEVKRAYLGDEVRL